MKFLRTFRGTFKICFVSKCFHLFSLTTFSTIIFSHCIWIYCSNLYSQVLATNTWLGAAHGRSSWLVGKSVFGYCYPESLSPTDELQMRDLRRAASIYNRFGPIKLGLNPPKKSVRVSVFLSATAPEFPDTREYRV